MQQEFFEFNFGEENQGYGDFVISSCNEEAYLLIQSWPNWNSHSVIIYGAKGSGKSSLARIWQKQTNAKVFKALDVYNNVKNSSFKGNENYIIENIENIHDEPSLFHFFNMVKENKGFLLMTAGKHPSNIGIRLPDLRSRLNAVPSAGLNNPDEEFLTKLILKLFSDRQLKVSMEVIEYMLTRIDRSFDNIQQLVDRIDQEALKQKKKITIPFVRGLLEMENV